MNGTHFRLKRKTMHQLNNTKRARPASQVTPSELLLFDNKSQQNFQNFSESILISRILRATMDPTTGINANSGRPAEALTARGFNPMPPPQNLSRAESSRGRGRHPSRSRTPNPSYVPRRQPQEPQLPVTFVGGRQLPNSEADLAAYGLWPKW
jgi:hypothetical protein